MKLPPIEKIHEAYSAITDNRVSISESDCQATVASSNGAKNYTVTWSENIYSSNDSATYWQGYPGYPVIAVLMLREKLTLNREVAALFADINWTELNDIYKRDYSKAVVAIIQERELDAVIINSAVNKVYDEIKELDIVIKRGSLKPPKN